MTEKEFKNLKVNDCIKDSMGIWMIIDEYQPNKFGFPIKNIKHVWGYAPNNKLAREAHYWTKLTDLDKVKLL